MDFITKNITQLIHEMETWCVACAVRTKFFIYYAKRSSFRALVLLIGIQTFKVIQNPSPCRQEFILPKI